MPEQPAWATPRSVALLIAAYLLTHFGVRLWIGPALGVDDAEQALFAQHWLPSYRLRAPPLFSWAVLAVGQAAGVGMLVISLLRYILLAIVLWLTYLTARRLIRDQRLAVLATLGLSAIYVLGYYSHHDLTHTTALSAFLAISWYVLVRLCEAPRLRWYLALGLCFGLGILAKWNFAVFALALPLACLAHPRYRGLVLTWKIVSAALVMGAIALPSALWAIGTGASAGDAIGGVLGERSGSLLLDLAKGTASLTVAVLAYPLPFLVIFLAAFGAPAWRGLCAPTAATNAVAVEVEAGRCPQRPLPLVARDRVGGLQNIDAGAPPTPSPSPHFGGAPSARRGGESGRGCGTLSASGWPTPAPDATLIARVMAIAVGLHWLLVPLVRATEFQERLLQPALLILPVYLFMLVERGLDRDGVPARIIRAYVSAIAAVAAVALSVRIGIHAVGADYCSSACRDLLPAEQIAAGLRSAGFSGKGTIVVSDVHLGGNLRVQLPNARVMATGYPARAWPEPAGHGQCLALWSPYGLPVEANRALVLSYLARELDMPAEAQAREGTFVVPYASSQRTYRLFYALYDKPQGDCR